LTTGGLGIKLLQTEVYMKTKENVDSKIATLDKLTLKKKPKSLRPMRSMVAVRSLKPKAAVATMIVKAEEMSERT
jgi:hypothetical protein